ncbi:MAG: DUF389 domain-containing protein [Scytonema sp. PMC 1069.18]|nr:DUF389 domain-containing protein [Scytonema sp. PMC 1069.18]MEC4886003.1 DUF389 domain-containing protein [Scytonema sp. PMC 1070.18]
MRQLIVQVPRGDGKQVLDIAKSLGGSNLAKFEAQGSERETDIVLVYVSNRNVEKLFSKLEHLPDVNITLMPRGVMPLHPPEEDAPQQVTNVEERSPIEIFLSSLQSVGSWRGFLAYAAVAGFVVWIGLYTNTIYLLTAAMLIAPFAGPAMNTAIATARGDSYLLGRSILRYFAALAVTIAIAAALSLIMRQEIATSLMIDTSQISSVTVLLPLAAGAAGALNLVQSERSSLVSGAATGMLVAASLAPPAGLVGMGAAIGRWDLVINALFLLFLQLVGINVTATLLFRVFGLTARGVRYPRGKPWVFPVALGCTVAILAGLLTWQFINPPNLQRSFLAQRANAAIQKVVDDNAMVNLVESNARFTRANIKGQNTLLSTVYVQRRAGVSASSEEIRSLLTQAIQTRLQQQNFNATPLVDVSVLDPPTKN